MRLAEALLERADLQRRVEALRSRIDQAASYQEGEEPAEDARALVADCLRTIATLERLVVAINRTNAAVIMADGRTVTAALASREALRTEHSVLVRAADAAGGGYGHRQMRSELRRIAALPVPELRDRADDVARRVRELDALIQRTNWEVELQHLDDERAAVGR